jgi:hypothetical protein
MGVLKQISDLYQNKASLSDPPRSDKWPTARKDYLKDHGTCTVCGGTKNLEVHHMKPFHVHPEFELDPTNFITLCEADDNGLNCHLLVGHLGDFKSVNLNVKEDAALWFTKLSTRPKDAKNVV